MALTKKPYKGTRDFFPADKRVQNYIFDKMRTTAQLFGYEPYDGPLLEEVELYKAKSGEELINEQIYSFTDRGKRFVAIRPEMTPTLARMVAQIHRETPKPIRWFAIPNLMRYEQPQKGRLREHWQFNCDIFGAPAGQGEIEILQVAITLLKNFGATNEHFEILLNDRAIVDAVFGKLMKLDNEKTYKLYKIVDRSKKVSKDAVEKMVDELDIPQESKNIFYSYLALSSFEEMFGFLSKHNLEDTTASIKPFYETLKDLQLVDFIKYDPTIVRGLDYYTGIVFEIFDKHPDNRRAICGGGTFANLLKIFNEDPLPGTGFGLGDVTLTDFLKTHNLLPDLSNPQTDLLITYQVEEGRKLAQKLAMDLRNVNISVVTNLECIKIKKVFPLATKKGAAFVGMIGDQEIANGEVQIKNMETREQINFKINDINSIVNAFKK